MKKANQLILTSLMLGLFLVYGAGNGVVLAQSYGNGTTNQGLIVDKKIRPIDNKNYFDNIGSEVKVFGEGDQIEFKIVVENRGNTTLTNIKVSDILPRYLNLIVYPGSYNSSNNSVNTEIVSLDPGQSKEFTVLAKISDLPAGTTNKLQMTNKVVASTNTAYDSDEAKYFVEMKAVPATGADDLLVKTGMVITVVGMALVTRKLVRGY